MRSLSLFVTFAMLVLPGLPAQIVDGSFESSTGGGVPSSPWVSNGAVTVFPGGSCAFELTWPTQGSNWCEIKTDGTSDVDGSDPASYRTGANALSQSFSWGSGSSVLTFDYAFMTGESPGSTAFNDFMLVEIEDASSNFVTVASLDTASGSFPQISTCNSSPLTATGNASIDLASAFPGSDSSTVFTLWVYCANDGDGAVTSRAYVDNIDNGGGGGPPSSPLSTGVFAIPAMGPAWWEIQTTSSTLTNVPLFHFISLTPAVPTGSGDWFGIHLTPEVVGQLSTPPGAAPFNVSLDGTGTYTFGPFNLDGGGFFTFDMVAVALDPFTGFIAEVSPAVNIVL